MSHKTIVHAESAYAHRRLGKHVVLLSAKWKTHGYDCRGIPGNDDVIMIILYSTRNADAVKKGPISWALAGSKYMQ